MPLTLAANPLLQEDIYRSPARGCYHHIWSHRRAVQKAIVGCKTFHLIITDESIMVGIADGGQISSMRTGEENRAIQLVDHLFF